MITVGDSNQPVLFPDLSASEEEPLGSLQVKQIF